MEQNNSRSNSTPFPRPNSNGYVPQPLDLDDIELNEKIRLIGDRLASNSHDVWGRSRVEQGWAYGPVRDDEKKTNPCMKYYDELSDADKRDDQDTAYSALRFILSKGYKIEECKSPSMSEMCRIAWTDHGRPMEKLDFSATVYIGVFGTAHVQDSNRLGKTLHSYFKSVYKRFDQSSALTEGLQGKSLTESKRYKENAHTHFVLLSALETESEQLASSIAAGYGIPTYQVVDGAVTDSVSNGVIYTTGSAADLICDYSLFALAVWDGVKGGDPYVESAVNRALKGSNARLRSLNLPDNITVDHLIVPSASGKDTGRKRSAYNVRTLHPYPLESGESWFYREGESRVKATDKYNESRFNESVEKITQFNRTVKEERETVMASDTVYDLLPGLHGHTETDRDLLRHIYTDAVSMSFQSKKDKHLKWMTWTAVGALLCFGLIADAPDILFGIDISSITATLGLLVVALFTAALLFYIIPRKRRYHEKYVDFRLMSECLRVQTYWKAAGVDAHVGDEFGAKSKLDFEWARYILRSWELGNAMYRPEGKKFSDRIINEVKKIWCGSEDDMRNGEYITRFDAIASQYVYSRSKAEKNRREARKYSKRNAFSLVATVILTILTGVIAFVQGVGPAFPDVLDYILLIAGLLQVWSAGYAFRNSSKDYDRLANNYSHLCIEYQKSIMAFAQAQNNNDRLEILHATGKEAIRENCVWAFESSNNEPDAPIS